MASIPSFIRQITHQANRFFKLVFSLAVLFSLILVALGSYNSWRVAQAFQSVIPPEVQLQRLSDDIIHMDEVLTMSARMAAATGDLKWETRYQHFEPNLDQTIKEAIALAPEAYATHAVQTDAANLKLVAMERQAFDLVRQGQAPDAAALLASPEYEQQKQIYADGIAQTTAALEQRLDASLTRYSMMLGRSSLFSLISLIILAIAWLVILGLLNQYIRHRRWVEHKLRAAKHQLEDSNARLTQSETALRQKATALQDTLDTLQQTQVKMIQSEKMSSLGLLVAGIAHELNNPINFIHGNLEFLETKAYGLLKLVKLYEQHTPHPPPTIQQARTALEIDFLYADFPQMLKSMYVGTDRLQQIVRSLRTFSRTDEAEKKEVDIHAGIDSTLLILRHRLQAALADDVIEVKKQYGSLPPVECYVGPLNQVFMNLLSNAIDAIEEAAQTWPSDNSTPYQPKIMIRTAVVGKNKIEVTIADNGIGMTPTIHQQMFEPFFTTKPIGKGTGMGMSISYQIIVERHGGAIDCRTAHGKGSAIRIHLPIQQSASPLTLPSNGHTPSPTPTHATKA